MNLDVVKNFDVVDIDLESIESLSDADFSLVIKKFRLIRNAFAENVDNVEAFIDSNNKNSSKFLKILNFNPKIRSERMLIVFRLCLQCLGNILVQKREIAHLIFDRYSTLNRLISDFDDPKITAFCDMIIYNCLLDNDIARRLIHESDYANFIQCSLGRLMDDSQSEWLLYTIQYLLQLDDRILTDCWDFLNFEQQIFLLEVLSSIPTANGCKFQILDIYCRMTSRFFDPQNFSTTDNSRLQFFALFDLVTKFLCDFYSVEEEESRNLRNTSIAEKIFSKTVQLLSEIQKLCREQHPLFKIDKNISVINGNSSARHLFHGLKQNLVNLIANISYKCPKIQHKGFELEAIYLILDCTKLDPNNPFMTQWAILAIRNLLENCPENQTLVNQMRANSIAEGLDEEFLQKLNLEPTLTSNGKVVFSRK